MHKSTVKSWSKGWEKKGVCCSSSCSWNTNSFTTAFFRVRWQSKPASMSTALYNSEGKIWTVNGYLREIIETTNLKLKDYECSKTENIINAPPVLLGTVPTSLMSSGWTHCGDLLSNGSSLGLPSPQFWQMSFSNPVRSDDHVWKNSPFLTLLQKWWAN